MIRLIPDKSAQSVNTEFLTLQQEVQFKRITSDYASFERVSNENQNPMIRRLFA
ncbi:IS30 family transposase [Lactovum miscens]|uniref:IS30 family transposase n=1 Tax=Lactovum miscens TaxID=190387 RepID=A0A841C6Z2_9LACT|nr:hypothetical protein [Lactovum miscens]MBB5888245.1 IS30 family transposase [Lactovum miscens]